VSVVAATVALVRRVTIGRLQVSVAQTRRERSRGLLGLDELPVDGALLLERCRSVHTIGMRFPIDAVLLDRGYRVLGVRPMPPGRILWPRLRVRHVLEVPPGCAPPIGVRLRISPAIPRPEDEARAASS